MARIAKLRQLSLLFSALCLPQPQPPPPQNMHDYKENNQTKMQLHRTNVEQYILVLVKWYQKLKF